MFCLHPTTVTVARLFTVTHECCRMLQCRLDDLTYNYVLLYPTFVSRILLWSEYLSGILKHWYVFETNTADSYESFRRVNETVYHWISHSSLTSPILVTQWWLVKYLDLQTLLGDTWNDTSFLRTQFFNIYRKFWSEKMFYMYW